MTQIRSVTAPTSPVHMPVGHQLSSPHNSKVVIGNGTPMAAHHSVVSPANPSGGGMSSIRSEAASPFHVQHEWHLSIAEVTKFVLSPFSTSFLLVCIIDSV